MSTQTTETVKPTQQELLQAEKIIKEQFPKLAPLLIGSRVVPFTTEQFDAYCKNSEQKQIEYLEKQLGVFKTTMEKVIETYTPKQAPTPSSAIGSTATKSVNREALEGAAKWYKENSNSPYHLKMDKEEWLKSFGYDPTVTATGQGWIKQEALTSGTQPLSYNRQVIRLPGGQMVVPIRQYCNYSTISGADKGAWYTIGPVTYGAITEGTAPSEDSVTITQVLATPTTRGAFLKVKYSQIEDNPFPLLETLANLGMMAAVDNEGTEILDTAFNAATMDTGNWVNGNTGAAISSDDASGMTLTLTGLAYADAKLKSVGFTQTPVFAHHPTNFAQLLVSTGLATFVQQGMPEITRTGLMETLLGITMIRTDNIHAQDNTTNDTYRNVLFIPGVTFMLASSRDA
ncbi:MAG: hypothetical protein DA330_09840, partial [Nitrososphaera sp.]|nr:hypothetical protein [Nitrososphaera sp.]